MKLRVLLSMFTALVVAHPALAQRGSFAVPAGAEMEKYPVLKKGEMTTVKMAQLGLRPVSLPDTVTVFNYFGKDNRFVYETLQKGTLVFVDKDGVLRYKEDCTNRIVKASDCPKCLGTSVALRADSATDAIGRKSVGPTRTERFQSGSWTGLLWELFWFLLALLAVIAAAGAIIWLLSQGSRLGSAEQNTSPATPVATPAPAPVATPAPTRAAVAQPVPVPTPVAPATPAVATPTSETPAPAAVTTPVPPIEVPSMITMVVSPEMIRAYPRGFRVRIDAL